MWVIYAVFYANMGQAGLVVEHAELVSQKPFSSERECLDARPHKLMYMRGHSMVAESCSFIEVLPNVKRLEYGTQQG